MIKTDLFTKTLCMSQLGVEHSKSTAPHFFFADSGKENSSFVFIISGSVTIKAANIQITIGSGSLFYIPENIRYNIIWDGTPDIEYYCFHIISNKHDINKTVGNFEVQHIPELSNENTKEIFIRIFDMFSTDDRLEKIKAVSLYYAFYANVLPHLKSETVKKPNKYIMSAVEYIEEHYAENFNTAALAEYCDISESRLYHLFCIELGTTPVKYRNDIRIEKAAQILRSSNEPIKYIATILGFNSMKHFRDMFRLYTNMNPKEYRDISMTDNDHIIAKQ